MTLALQTWAPQPLASSWEPPASQSSPQTSPPEATGPTLQGAALVSMSSELFSQRKDFPFAPQVWSKGITDFLHLDPSYTLSSHLAPIIPMRVKEDHCLYIGGVSQWDSWAFTSGPFMHIWYALSSWRHKTETGLGLLVWCGHWFHEISRVSKQHQGGKNKEAACNHSSHTHRHTHRRGYRIHLILRENATLESTMSMCLAEVRSSKWLDSLINFQLSINICCPCVYSEITESNVTSFTFTLKIFISWGKI